VITLVDILGFKEIIATGTFQSVSMRLRTVRRLSGADPSHTGEDGEAKIIQFSDSIIRIRPLDAEANKSRYGLLFFEFLDLVHMQGELVNHGICIRGGISIGDVHYENDTIFGPGFVRAYELESVYARFPRIVIDPTLIAQLKSDKRLSSKHNELPEEVRQIRRNIRKDFDGVYFIDYLQAFIDEIDDQENVPLFLANHRRMILASSSKFGELNPVSAKFLWLATYHNTLIAGIQPKFLKHHGLKREELSISEQEMPVMQLLEE
jgi:hypothetical protein